MYTFTLIVTLILTTLCFTHVQAKGNHREQHFRKDYGAKICKHENLAKIFPSAGQLIIQSDGIFVYTAHNTLLKGQFVAMEDGQVYVAVSNPLLLPRRGPCGIHRVYHKACGGCGVLLCPMNCTCFD